MSYTGCTHADWLTGGWTEYYTGYTKQPSIPIQNTQSTQSTQSTYFIKTKSRKDYTLTTLRLNN